MHDVAVLLNCTGKLTFEMTDSLMSLVNVEEPLLFYDRLSVKKFPSDAEQAFEQVKTLISKLRNLLEARVISFKDDNERIRLIVTLDLSGGLFHDDAFSKTFPAQKVKRFCNLVEKVFEQGNPLLKRFDYVFIFVNSVATNGDMADFYQQSAYDGFSNTGQGWMTKDDIQLKAAKDDVFRHLDSPDQEALLTQNEIYGNYKAFEEELKKTVESVAEKMDGIGLKNEFLEMVRKKTADIQTIGDFEAFDYESEIVNCVSNLIGLRAKRFEDGFVFFILRYDESTVALKRRDEVFVKALVQFLSTISHEDFETYFKSTALNELAARLFVLGGSSMSDIDKDAVKSLRNYVRACKPVLDGSKWTESMEVTYNTYELNSSDPANVDTHKELNDQYAMERQTLYDDFVKKRKVPFFFGKKLGDWSWFKTVVESAENLFDFETINERPLYDPPKRITNEEMKSTPVTSSYRAMEDEKNKLAAKDLKVMHLEDLNSYLVKRRKLMNQMEEGIDAMKRDMPKLGFFVSLLCMGILSTLAFTLCYAFHFFWFDNSDSLYLIAIAFGAAGLLFILSAVIGQASVKGRIKAAHRIIDDAYTKMQDNLRTYLEDVKKRVAFQNEADLRKRNLDEMQSKLDEFKRHNKRIDLWSEHYAGIVGKLEDILQLIGERDATFAETSDTMNFDEDDFSYEVLPSLPDSIIDKFKDMSTYIMNNNLEIKSVTCMVKHFRFTEIK